MAMNRGVSIFHDHGKNGQNRQIHRKVNHKENLHFLRDVETKYNFWGLKLDIN